MTRRSDMPNSPPSARIFISYRREDSAGHSGRLFDRITSYFGDRAKVFMDIDSINPGEDFIEVVKNAVAECDVLIAVIGKEWLTAVNEQGQRRLENHEDFVRVEVGTALERDIRVIPVLVEGASIPRHDQLPEALAKLSRRNAIELSDVRWKYDVDRLIKTIEDVLTQRALNRSQSVDPPTDPLASKAGTSFFRSWRGIAV